MWKLTLLFLFVFIPISACAIDSTHVVAVRVCYLPFDYETFGPVTRRQMEKQKCKVFYEQDSVIKKLYKYIDNNNQKNSAREYSFDGNRVRLKIAVTNTPAIFVDAEGVVEREGKLFKLSQANKEAISQLLKGVFGYED